LLNWDGSGSFGAAHIVYRNLVVITVSVQHGAMTTKWGQRWTGATLGPGGTKFGGALRAEKEKRGAEPRSTKGK